MNNRFVLANVKSHIEERPEDANVQARSRQKLGETRRGNLSAETVKETRSCQNEPRVALGGVLKNLVLVKSIKRMMDHLIYEEKLYRRLEPRVLIC